MKTFIGTIKSYITRMWIWWAAMSIIVMFFAAVSPLALSVVLPKMIAILIGTALFIEVIDFFFSRTDIRNDIANGRAYAATNAVRGAK